MIRRLGVVLAVASIFGNALPGAAVAQSFNSPQGQAAKGFGQFGGQGQGDRSDRWRNNQPFEALSTPYMVRTGAVIPAMMVTPIISDLPGQIIGQVSQNVYDSATGRHLLIPQGARLIGTYSSDVAYGQERVLFAWQRIVFPDGRALDIGAMPGADGRGASGASDQVNNHYVRIFGSALLLSLVSAGFKLALPDDRDTEGRRTRSQSLSESVAEQLGQTAGEAIRKNMNIAPTLEIRPGFRVNVMVVKDLEFPGPYRPFGK